MSEIGTRKATQWGSSPKRLRDPDVSARLMNREHLPFYPEPLNKEELKSIYENQTSILEWLKSIGHEIEDGPTAQTYPRKESRT